MGQHELEIESRMSLSLFLFSAVIIIHSEQTLRGEKDLFWIILPSHSPSWKDVRVATQARTQIRNLGGMLIAGSTWCMLS